MKIVKIIRNWLLYIAGLIVAYTVFVGVLMTNSEIKHNAQMAGYFVLAAFVIFMLQCVWVMIPKRKSKRGVTFY